MGWLAFDPGIHSSTIPTDSLTNHAKKATATLRWYCGYILCLALNGSLEAFVFAVATGRQVGLLAALHTACSLLFAASCVPLMRRLATAGIVAANCVAMAPRIAFSAATAARYFRQHPSSSSSSSSSKASGKKEAAEGLSDGSVDDLVDGSVAPLTVSSALPHPFVCGAFALAALVTRASDQWRVSDGGDLSALPRRLLLALVPPSPLTDPFEWPPPLQGAPLPASADDGGALVVERLLRRDLPHVAVGGAMLLLVVAVALLFDGPTVRDLGRLLAGSASKKRRANSSKED